MCDLNIDVGLFPGFGIKRLPFHVTNCIFVEAHPALECVVLLCHLDFLVLGFSFDLRKLV